MKCRWAEDLSASCKMEGYRLFRDLGVRIRAELERVNENIFSEKCLNLSLHKDKKD